MTASRSSTRISETAVRAALDRRARRVRSPVRRSAGALHSSAAATDAPGTSARRPEAAGNGVRLLRRWSVAELIAGGTARPFRPAAV